MLICISNKTSTIKLKHNEQGILTLKTPKKKKKNWQYLSVLFHDLGSISVSMHWIYNRLLLVFFFVCVIRSGRAVFGSLFSAAHPGICDYPLTATEGAFLTLSTIMRERLAMPSSHFLSPPPSPLFHSITHSSPASWLHYSTHLSSCCTISSVIMAVMTASSFCLDGSLFCLWTHHAAKVAV